MGVKMTGGEALSNEAVDSLERALGCAVSPSFRSFLASSDGAKPEGNIFKIGEGNEAGVSQFIPAASIPEERLRLGDLPGRAYPVAWAEGGNYVIIDEASGGAVYFWDHEIEGELTKLADDFQAFLEQLASFDPQSVQLDPSQVKKVWIDPEFLARLGKK